MKRSVIKAIIKMCAKSILLAAIIGAVIGAIGYFNKWDSALAYSDAFFVAGCLMILAGTSSRFAARQGGAHYQLLNAKGFREMSSGEWVNFIVDASSSMRTVILGLLTGLLLMLISAIAAKIS